MDFDFDDMDGDETSKVSDFNKKWIEILEKPEVQKEVKALREQCETLAQFEAKRSVKLAPFLDDFFKENFIELSWIENQNWVLKEDNAEIKEQFDKIVDLFQLPQLGPLKLDKGDCVRDEEDVGVALGFKDGAYNVRFFPENMKKVMPGSIKKLDRGERMVHILEQVLMCLSSPEAQAALDELRQSAKREEFEEKKLEKVQKALAPLCKHHCMELSEIIESGKTMSDGNTKVAEKSKQVDAAFAFTLGPLELARGDCVEISGVESPEQRHLNGKSGVVWAWFEDKKVYEVRPAGDQPAYLAPGTLRKQDDLEKVKAIQTHIMNVVNSPGAQAALDGLRAKCPNMMAYAKKLPDTMRQISIPALESFGVDFEWYNKMLETHTKDRELRSMAKRIDTLTSFGKIGPWGLEKGAFYEAYDIKDPEKKGMNGAAVLILSWDDGKGAYDVTPVGKPSDTTQLPADNLRPVSDKAFASKDEAASFQKEVLELYSSSAAKDALKKLKADKPDIREYLVGLKPVLLELQKPLLKKFGFREDLVGMNHTLRALAPFSGDADFAQRTQEMEKFGSEEMRYDGRVAVVTGAGRGLGRAYAKILAARGAKVVVSNRTRAKADEVVAEIKGMGGEAVAEYSDVAQDPSGLVPFALEKYGKIDILVANAGQLDDHRFEIMKTEYFTTLLDIHVYGHVKILKDAWPEMVKNKYGRVVIIASTSGLFGNFGQSNYAAAKMAMTSFGQTMAIEGFKDNIFTNIVCPVGLTRMTNELRPIPFRASDWELTMAPQPSDKTVAFLAHESCKTTAGIFIAEEGHISSVRWQSDDQFVSFEPGNPNALEVIASQWPAWGEWKKVSYPGMDVHAYRPGGKVPAEPQGGSGRGLPKAGDKCRYTDKVAVVTGGGHGLGRSISMFLGARGAKVLVHDADVKKADKTVADIKAQGGEAVADYTDLYASGEVLVENCMEKFDQIDILVCNSTKREDASLEKMTFDQFKDSMDHFLIGHVKVLQAAWPQMYMGRFGRIVLLTSESGLYGASGQFSYGAAKGTMLGVAQTLAMEGYKYNILTNAIATVDDKLTDDELEAKPASVVAPIGFLCHESCKATAGIFRVNGGKVSSLRIETDEAFVDFDTESGDAALETVASQWTDVARYSKTGYPGQMTHFSYR